MTWEERIRLYGAPGPRVADRFSGSKRPRERVIRPSHGQRIFTPPPAGPIIVGIEGSERSADALALADLFAGLLKGPLVLVHNHPREAERKLLEPRRDEQPTRLLYESTFAQVHKLVTHDHEPGIQVTKADSPAEGLEQIAALENAQLIVVGPSHHSGLGRVCPGSVGERLLCGTPVPVATAPRGFADEAPAIGLIASAFDGSPESRRALDWAADLARRSSSRLRVITVHAPTAYAEIGFAAADGPGHPRWPGARTERRDRRS